MGRSASKEAILSELIGPERARYVQEMFTRIAPHYDLMNRLMTVGQDVAWRKEVIRRAKLPRGGRLLDLGAGTGDLSREALRQEPTCQAVAADFTLDMMRTGRQSATPASAKGRLDWSAADAICLPYQDASFHAVVSGFLMRNVIESWIFMVSDGDTTSGFRGAPEGRASPNGKGILTIYRLPTGMSSFLTAGLRVIFPPLVLQHARPERLEIGSAEGVFTQ